MQEGHVDCNMLPLTVLLHTNSCGKGPVTKNINKYIDIYIYISSLDIHEEDVVVFEHHCGLEDGRGK